MPTIEQSQASFKARTESGDLIPAVAENPPVIPSAPIPDYPMAPNPFQRGPLPASMSMQPDTQRQWHSSMSPQSRVSPISPNANPNIGATAASQAITIVRTGQGTILKTDNILNNIQSELNLIGGTNITLTAGAQGQVTIDGSASGGGPGLAFGDPINYPQIDPASIILADDFCEGVASATATGAGADIGQLDWNDRLVNGTSSFTISGSIPNVGILSINTGVTNSSGYQLYLSGAHLGIAGEQSSAMLPPGDFPGWKMTWIFRMATDTFGPRILTPNTVSLVFYLGLGGGDSVIANARRSSGMWLRFDKTLSDTTYKFECVANATDGDATQGTVIDTGVTPDFNWHRLQIRSTTAGTILFQLDNTAEQSIAAPSLVMAVGNTALNRTTNTVQFNFPSTGTQILPGQNIVIASTTGATNFNGTFTIIGNRGLAGEANWNQTAVNDANTPGGGTATIFPAMSPYLRWGNSAAGTPVQKTLFIDYFAFIYNPMLANSWIGTAADAAKARWYSAAT